MSSSESESRSDGFYAYNQYRYKGFIEKISNSQRLVLQAIPLLFHVNINNAPGYIGDSTPCGIKLYEVEPDDISALNKVIKRVVPDEKLILASGEEVIEAIYLQERFRTGENILWIIFEDDLDKKQVLLLERKALAIQKWAFKSGLNFNFKVSDRRNIANSYNHSICEDFHIDKYFFMQDFYVENIAISGKFPTWWVSDDESVEGKSEIDEEDYLDFDIRENVRLQDYYAAAIWYLLSIKKDPVNVWLDMVLLKNKLKSGESAAEYSSIIKGRVNSGYYQNTSISALDDYSLYVNGVLPEYCGDDKFVGQLCNVCSIDRSLNSGKSIFDCMFQARSNNRPFENVEIFGLDNYIRIIEKIYLYARNEFVDIRRIITENSEGGFSGKTAVESVTKKILLRLERSAKNICILNNSMLNTVTQEKIIIERCANKASSPWSLIAPISNLDDQPIKYFTSLVELVSWAYINEVVSTSTRIMLKGTSEYDSIDVVNLIKVIAENVSINNDCSSDLNIFTENAEPVKSILLVSTANESSGAESVRIEQLVVYSDGEFYTSEFHGYEEFIARIHKSAGDKNEISSYIGPLVKVCSVKPGAAQEAKLLIEGLLSDLSAFFSRKNNIEGRSVVRIGNAYYVTQIKKDDVTTTCCQGVSSLYQSLEAPLSEFTTTHIAFSNNSASKLNLVLKKNISNRIQLFYYVESRRVSVYVLDENGSLFVCEQAIFDKESFINHWLLFFNNIRKNLSDNVCFDINEITENSKGGYVTRILKGDGLPDDKKYYALEFKVFKNSNGNNIEFICENEIFRSDVEGDGLYGAIAEFLEKNTGKYNDYPIYISNVEISSDSQGIKDLPSAYVLDRLKYKRNIESRLVQKLYSS